MPRLLVLCLVAAVALPAHADKSANTNPQRRLTLAEPATLDTAPLTGSRYTLKARFAPVASAGELREGANFTLIGRVAKGGLNCDFTAVFSDGFEGN